jgi:hypothetical protein
MEISADISRRIPDCTHCGRPRRRAVFSKTVDQRRPELMSGFDPFGTLIASNRKRGDGTLLSKKISRMGLAPDDRDLVKRTLPLQSFRSEGD